MRRWSSIDPTFGQRVIAGDVSDLLVWTKCSKYLQSTNSNSLVVSRIKTKTGSRGFSISGLALWNTLPVPMRDAETIFNIPEITQISPI